MNNIINKIIEMDNTALTIMEGMQELLKNNQSQLNGSIARMEREMLHKARETGQKIYEGLIKEADLEKQNILEQADSECRELERIFIDIHEGLEKDIFEQIFFK